MYPEDLVSSQLRVINTLKCPLCGKDMSGVKENSSKEVSDISSGKLETVYVCEQHGVMNKTTDLKDKVDQIAKKV
jgi:hypothetical protein